VQYGLREFFAHGDDVERAGLKGGLGDQRVVIQGLGNVGYHAARLLEQEDGARIVAILERDGALVDENGLSVERVHEHMRETGGVRGFPDARYEQQGAALLEMDCDLLIPAALEGQITAENAGRIRARLIAEAANGPTTADADDVLRERGVTVLPDVFLNAGGVTVSYFEWVKNLSHIRFGRMERRLDELRSQRIVDLVEAVTGKQVPDDAAEQFSRSGDEEERVLAGLDDTLRASYRELSREFRSNEGVDDLRAAAYCLAIRKIAHAYDVLGL
jgi:glutamate dehydrogenase (NAD(P)+)